jgi:hypothetical protein
MIKVDGGEAAAALRQPGCDAVEEHAALLDRQVARGGHHGFELGVVQGDGVRR